MMMENSQRIDVPLVAVGCDFRSANVGFREQLVTTRDQREAMYRGIAAMDATAGFAALETCNRVEWIVSTEHPQWMADLLRAQIEQRWRKALPEITAFPEPSVYIGRRAARHLLRVVAGLESLAAGEAQIAGQFQDALLRAREEEMSSPVLNRLASHAGRLAKSGIRIGYRADHRRGIHGMAAEFLKSRFDCGKADLSLAVLGMGSIGRKTAEVLEQELPGRVVRVNRTVGDQHIGKWIPISEFSSMTDEFDAVVVATGALEPVLSVEQFNMNGRREPLILLDIGIPSQLTPEAQKLEGLLYSNLDDLISLGSRSDTQQQLAAPMEQEVRTEAGLFKRFCIERSIVTLLEETQQRRKQFILEQIPSIVEDLQDLDSEQRKAVESAMKQLISDYARDSFNSIHNLLEQKWNEL